MICGQIFTAVRIPMQLPVFVRIPVRVITQPHWEIYNIACFYTQCAVGRYQFPCPVGQISDIMMGSTVLGCVVCMPGLIELKLCKEKGIIEFLVNHIDLPSVPVRFYLIFVI